MIYKKLNINLDFQNKLTNLQGLCLGNLFIYLFFVVILFGLNSCDIDKPVASFDTKVRTETVWIVDLETNENDVIILFKTFDEKGNLLNVVNYDDDGIKIEESSFKYEGKNSEESKIFFDRSGGVSSKEQIKSLYDVNGRIHTKELVKNNDTTTKTKQNFTYDDLGNVIKIIEHKSNNTIERKFEYSFDNVGKISEIIYVPDNIQVGKRDSLIYNNDENYIKMYSIDFNGNVESAIQYKYNKLGKIITTNFYDKNSVIIKKYNHIYTYF